MKRTFKVIYNGSSDEENFTFNQSYLAMRSSEGLLTVLSDSGTLIEMPEDQFAMEAQEVNQSSNTEVI